LATIAMQTMPKKSWIQRLTPAVRGKGGGMAALIGASPAS
jgi:hypothetical protein